MLWQGGNVPLMLIISTCPLIKTTQSVNMVKLNCLTMGLALLKTNHSVHIISNYQQIKALHSPNTTMGAFFGIALTINHKALIISNWRLIEAVRRINSITV
jgi:hypothetical protein